MSLWFSLTRRRGARLVPISVWAVVLIFTMRPAAQLPQEISSEPRAFMPATLESMQVDEAVASVAPGREPAEVLVIYFRPQGLSASDRAVIDTDADRIRHALSVDIVLMSRGPMTLAAQNRLQRELASDRTGWARLTSPASPGQSDRVEVLCVYGARGRIEELRALLRARAPSEGAPATFLSGPAVAAEEDQRHYARRLIWMLVSAAGLAALILLAASRSVRVSAPPIATGLAAVVVAGAAARQAAHAGLAISGPAALTMIAIAIGAGTALGWQIAQEARAASSLRKHAWGAAARAILVRGAAALCALVPVCLITPGSPAASVAACSAIAIVVATIAASTLTPALCGLARGHVPSTRQHRARLASKRGSPWLAVLSLLALATLSVGAWAKIKDSVAPDPHMRSTPSSRGQELAQRALQQRVDAPVLVLLDTPANVPMSRAQLMDVTYAATRTANQTEPQGLVVAEDARRALLAIYTDSGPFTARSQAAIRRLRSHARALERAYGVRIRVGGSAAQAAETQRRARDALPVVLFASAAMLLMALISTLRALVPALLATALAIMAACGGVGAAALVGGQLSWSGVDLWAVTTAVVVVAAISASTSGMMFTQAGSVRNQAGMSMLIVGGLYLVAVIPMAAASTMVTHQLAALVMAGMIVDLAAGRCVRRVMRDAAPQASKVIVRRRRPIRVD